MTLTTEEIAAAWATLETPAAEPARTKVQHYHHYRPFADAADALIREAQDQHRVFTGQPEFDHEMRGIGSGHLMGIVGYSHSGKTQWLLRMLRHNKNKRIAFWIPDEPATLVLAKLASIQSGVPARELEARIADRDNTAIELLRNTALDEFPNLVVFDKPLTPTLMRDSYSEVCDVWGAEPDLMIVDYVDLIQAGETAQAKFDFLKAFNTERNGRMVAIHQTSRSAGADGRKMTISSGNYGGEQHCTFMVGVRRKKSALAAEQFELQERVAKGSDAAAVRLAEVEHALSIHKYTITVNLVKNKRPGGGLVDDIDLEIDQDTGRLHDLNGDLPSQYLLDVERDREVRAEKARTHHLTVGRDEQTTLGYEGEF